VIHAPFPTARERVGALASRVYPGLDEALWHRRRGKERRGELDSPPYLDLRRRRPAARRAYGPAADLGRSSHLVVLPQHGPAFESFRPGTRNFYYEAAQNARENYGADRVSVFRVDPGEPLPVWQARLVDYLLDTGATHLLTHIEVDPGLEDGTWHWDTVWSQLITRWDGVLLGVMFDSAFRWVAAKSRLLAQMSPNFVVVDICMPMDGVMVRGRPEVGPVNMPVSRESLALVDARLKGLEPSHDVSFIGALYPYRVELIESLRALGVSVAVNPHRPDPTSDLAQSRANQPSWLDYMAGLRQSHMTINFSRSSAGEFEQLKTRVLEATLARTLLLTDDRERTRLFFQPETEYAYFPDPAGLPAVVERFLADPAKLRAAQEAGEARARQLAHRDFLDGIDRGLRRRGLQALGAG
jgi:hypothetical protein